MAAAGKRATPLTPTFEDLMSEAQTLARPCVRLSIVRNHRGPVGRWGGPPSPGIELAGTHLLSFDLAALPREFSSLGLSGCASVHGGPEGKSLDSEFAITRRLPDWSSYPRARRYRRLIKNPFTGEPIGRFACYDDIKNKSVPLYAHDDLSLPFLGDLCTFGSPRIARYLEDAGGSLEDWAGERMPEDSPVKAYLDAWSSHVWGPPGGAEKYGPSLAREGTVAILGGWFIPILYSYTGPPPGGRLLVSTFADSEPWRYVWLRPDGTFAVQDIIT